MFFDRESLLGTKSSYLPIGTYLLFIKSWALWPTYIVPREVGRRLLPLYCV